MTKEPRSLTSWKVIGWIIFILFLYHLFFNSSTSSTSYGDTNDEIQDLQDQVDCLNDYIYDLQEKLKMQPESQYNQGDVRGALSVYFPAPSC